MQCTSSTTNSPLRRATVGRTVSRKRSLANRSGEISSTSISSALELRLDRLPVGLVGAVDRGGADRPAPGGGDLVAHEAEQRRDDASSGRRPGGAASRWRRSRPRSSPTRCAARRAPAAAPPPGSGSPPAGRGGTGPGRRRPAPGRGSPRRRRRPSVCRLVRFRRCTGRLGHGTILGYGCDGGQIPEMERCPDGTRSPPFAVTPLCHPRDGSPGKGLAR